MAEKDLALEALMDFFDAVEAGIAQAKQHVKQAKTPEKTKGSEEELDFNKLFWEQKQGEKGPFEQTSEKANGNSDLWKKLKAKVKEHNGFCQYRGYRFWFDMQNENVVDRRKA
jgi:hypothetical protein